LLVSHLHGDGEELEVVVDSSGGLLPSVGIAPAFIVLDERVHVRRTTRAPSNFLFPTRRFGGCSGGGAGGGNVAGVAASCCSGPSGYGSGDCVDGRGRQEGCLVPIECEANRRKVFKKYLLP